jgi:hypothetical protein
MQHTHATSITFVLFSGLKAFFRIWIFFLIAVKNPKADFLRTKATNFTKRAFLLD